MKQVFLITLIILNKACPGQGPKFRPVEYSPFYASAVSFSRLAGIQDNAEGNFYNSKPVCHMLNFGLRMETQISQNTREIYANTSVGYSRLSISANYKTQTEYGGYHANRVVVPGYVCWSAGAKKKIGKSLGKFKPNVEAGVRAYFLLTSKDMRFTGYPVSNDTAIKSVFTFNKQRNLTFVPYAGYGWERICRRTAIGIQFWAQRALQPMFAYDLMVTNRGSVFKCRSVSYGMALGVNVYVKLFSF